MLENRENTPHLSELDAVFRHEYKYEIDNLQLEILKSKLSQVMLPDSHTNPSGGYQVRSLYFDDYDNSCYYENEDGNDNREKFRIRIYDASDSRITLELKKKVYGKTLKQSCPITKDQVNSLISGESLEWDDGADPLMKKFYIWLQTRYGRPKVIVNYERIPFVCPDGNVRVTLDTNISSSIQLDTFFFPQFQGRPIMPTGRHILEVKFDAFIPDHISRTIPTNQLSRVTCSKYYLCRKLGGIL